MSIRVGGSPVESAQQGNVARVGAATVETLYEGDNRRVGAALVETLVLPRTPLKSAAGSQVYVRTPAGLCDPVWLHAGEQ